MGWGNFTAALIAFFAAHAIPSVPGVKPWLKARLGRSGYGAFFGLLSVVLLVWVIVAAGRAPLVILWDQHIWMRWAVNLAMPAAVLLATLATGAPNPLSFGGHRAGFDPARPGVAGITRHPLLWALLLWSGAHLLVNGDMAHALMFGSFAVFCPAGMVLLDARRQREMGAAEWHRQAAKAPLLPFGHGFAPLRGWRPSTARLGVALLVWLLLLGAHPHVIGVSPLP